MFVIIKYQYYDEKRTLLGRMTVDLSGFTQVVSVDEVNRRWTLKPGTLEWVGIQSEGQTVSFTYPSKLHKFFY